MIAGHLSVKNGYWHAILSYKDELGKRKRKSIATHLKEKGNKRKAEEKLQVLRKEYSIKLGTAQNSKGIYFHDYMLHWLSDRQNEVSKTTYAGYSYNIKNSIVPYFKERSILLSELKASDINYYYKYLLNKGLSSNTVTRHHANIHRALKDEYLRDLIDPQILDRITRPKKEKFLTTVYSADECIQLIEAAKGEKLEIIIALAIFLGLRRSEILGLRWKAINFTDNTVIINHTVTVSVDDGHYSTSKQDKVKRKSSLRTLPIPEPLHNYLIRECQERYGNNKPNPDDYICVDENGNIIKPNYVSQAFIKILEKNGLRRIRFHDLRHSCANLLVTARIPLIEVQQWMGHSNISTTADMYSHLAFGTKLNSAETIKKI